MNFERFEQMPNFDKPIEHKPEFTENEKNERTTAPEDVGDFVAEDFEDLYEELEDEEELQGTGGRSYQAQELIEKINKARSIYRDERASELDRQNALYAITRTRGLRDLVEKLLKEDK